MPRVVMIGLIVVAMSCGRIGFPPQADRDATVSVDAFELVPPSCVGLPATCGADHAHSCCGSPLVPKGTFYRSFDISVDGQFASMAYPATVNDFRLDTYEVTVGRFRAFVEAGLGTQANPPAAGSGLHPGLPGTGWNDTDWKGFLEVDTPTLVTKLGCNPAFQTWTPTPGANENLAMNCITWYESFAFCAWDGGFLPTEAEWNYAAAGGEEQRAYPWSSPAGGTTIDCSYANYDATNYCVNPPTGAVSPVGSYSPKSDGRWGQADLGGNLWEKVLDIYETPYTIPNCNNCVDLAMIDARTVRGGAFNADLTSSRTGNRYYDPPYERYIEMGARCARLP